MKWKLILDIAFSLLWARWRQTLVAAVGVTFGIAMFITLLSFMTGLNDLLDGLIVNRTPHIKLFNEVKPSTRQPISLVPQYQNFYHIIHSVKPGLSRTELYNSEAITQALLADARVKGVAPKLNLQVFYSVGNINLTGTISGIDVEQENSLFNFSDYVVKGNYIDLKYTPNSIVLGKGAAEKMMANIGDLVVVTTPQGEQFTLKVVGYFQSGLLDFDKVQSFTSLATAQKLLGKPPGYITDLQVKLHDMQLAPQLSKSMASIFNCDAEDIQTANSQFETGTFVRTLISYAVGITLLIVAGFGIYNILNMMIYEKMDTIAILKATGFSGRDVMGIFLSIAMSIGIFGGILGLGIGYVLASIIDQIPFNTAALPTITTYPVSYNIKFYIIGITFALITCFLSGLFPAKKAGKVDPVIIIRGK